jgi:UDP-2,3-diacylglucosamine hydrolase
MRDQSESQKQSGMAYADADTAQSLQWLQAAQANRLVHGHTHRPADYPLGSATRQVLSDWSLDHAPLRAEVLRLHADGRSERLGLI